LHLQEVNTRGPREPWHDLHSKIDGPAAYDVLKNFEERWLKAAKRHGLKKMGKSYDDTLLNLKSIPEICLDDAPYMSDNDPESWHVQVCSIIKLFIFIRTEPVQSGTSRS
jgi:phospholipase D1/2